MNYPLVIGAALFFLLHLACESASSFVKYNFAGLGRHMYGMSLSNMFAIASRGFVAAYGLLIAYIVERDISSGFIYGMLLSISLLLGAGISYWFSLKTLAGRESFSDLGSWRSFFSWGNSKSTSKEKSSINISLWVSLLLGLQFVAIVIAYGLCFRFPQHRLFIVSLVPVISMAGTLATVVFVEPKFATLIDASTKAGHIASDVFMRARAISFGFSSVLMFLLTVFLGYG